MPKIKVPYLLIIIVILGLITRGYQLQTRFLYAHDGDLASWIIKDIVIDKHFRLIGQQTSASGIFIGPLFYYALIPFYMLTNMDPVGGLGLPLLIGMVAVFSVYWVTSKLYSPLTGKFAGLIYAVSFAISQNEREMVPTTPVMLWSVWFYYFIHRLFQKQKSSLIWLAVLFALVWHFNLALILLSPLVIIAIVKNWSIFKIRDFIVPILLFIILSTPLWIFEFKHNFIQSRSLVTSLVDSGHKSSDYIGKISHVILYASRNANSIIWNKPDNLSVYLVPGLLLISLFLFIIIRRLPKYIILIYLPWLFLYILFFAFNSLNLSEYYLNGLNVLWVILFALILSFMYTSKYLKPVSLIIMMIFIPYHLYLFFTSNINHFGYLEKKALVDYIKTDAKNHNYPCVSVSYITSPGYNLGYRYFFYLDKIHVNQSISGSPVYTIVFPHSMVDRLDKTFGALGLIFPDYGRYSTDTVKISCSGQDSNLTDPMFGFTK